jgi:hypothetical protein
MILQEMPVLAALYSGVVGLEHRHKKVLNKIVEKEGNCLINLLCDVCPFRTKCLPEFLDKKTVPTRKERYEMAADMLARIELMLDEN